MSLLLALILPSLNTATCAWLPPHTHTLTQQPAAPPALYFDLDSLPPDLTASHARHALEQAAKPWQNLGCVPDFNILDSPTADTAPVRFVDQDPCLPPSFLAFTVYACQNHPYGTILLNKNAFSWQTHPSPLEPHAPDGTLRIDLQAVLTHEIGHVLGLGHLEDPLATMAANYLHDGGQRTLAAADKLAVCAHYNSPINECTPGCACVQDQNRAVCEEERGDIGDFCATDLLICPHCIISSPHTHTGYCSQPCGECPDDMACINQT